MDVKRASRFNLVKEGVRLDCEHVVRMEKGKTIDYICRTRRRGRRTRETRPLGTLRGRVFREVSEVFTADFNF